MASLLVLRLFAQTKHVIFNILRMVEGLLDSLLQGIFLNDNLLFFLIRILSCLLVCLSLLLIIYISLFLQLLFYFSLLNYFSCFFCTSFFLSFSHPLQALLVNPFEIVWFAFCLRLSNELMVSTSMRISVCVLCLEVIILKKMSWQIHRFFNTIKDSFFKSTVNLNDQWSQLDWVS